MTRIVSRAILQASANCVEVAIPAVRHGWMSLMLPLWLCGWLPMGRSIAQGLKFPADFGDLGSLVFQLPWLAIWSVGSLCLVGKLLWSAFGLERVRFTQVEVTVFHRILWFERRMRYRARNVKYLRAFRPMRVAVAGPVDDEPCKVAFDYGDKTVFFASGVDEAEAFRLVHTIKAHAPWLDTP